MRRSDLFGTGRWSRRSGIPLAATSLVALLAATPVLWSCAESSSPAGPEIAAPASTGPSAPSLQTDDLLGFSTDGVLTFLQPPDLTQPRHTGKLIRKATGGSIQLSGFKLTIPPDALDRDTFITIDLPPKLPEANFVVADFGPDGLKFLKPVTIRMPLTGVNLMDVDLSTVKIWFWDGTKWKSPTGTATSTSVVGKATHFSTYGARGGIDTSSGG